MDGKPLASARIDLSGSATNPIKDAGVLAIVTAVMEHAALLSVTIARSNRSLRNSSTDLVRVLSNRFSSSKGCTSVDLPLPETAPCDDTF